MSLGINSISLFSKSENCDSSSIFSSESITSFISWSLLLKPVAIIVTLTESPNSPSIAVPNIISTFSEDDLFASFVIVFNSRVDNSLSPPPETIFSKIFFAPLIFVLLSRGDVKALLIAISALSVPDASAEPKTDVPASFITVFTSSKSTLICPGTVTISAIHFALVAIISSAFSNAFDWLRSP